MGSALIFVSFITLNILSPQQRAVRGFQHAATDRDLRCVLHPSTDTCWVKTTSRTQNETFNPILIRIMTIVQASQLSPAHCMPTCKQHVRPFPSTVCPHASSVHALFHPLYAHMQAACTPFPIHCMPTCKQRVRRFPSTVCPHSSSVHALSHPLYAHIQAACTPVSIHWCRISSRILFFMR